MEGHKNKSTCGQPHVVYMFAQDEQPCDSVDNVFDGHKKKTRTTQKNTCDHNATYTQ